MRLPPSAGSWERARQIPTVIHDFDTHTYFRVHPLHPQGALIVCSWGNPLARSRHPPSCRALHARRPQGAPATGSHLVPCDSRLRAGRCSARADGAGGACEARGGPRTAFIFGCITKLGPERGTETLSNAFRRVAATTFCTRASRSTYRRPAAASTTRVPKRTSTSRGSRDVQAMRASLERQVAELQLGDRVYLVETEGSVLPYYAASDVLAAPFENERFSSVNLVEGLAYGKPFSVGTDIGEAREIHAQHGVGNMAAPGDAACSSECDDRRREAAAACSRASSARARSVADYPPSTRPRQRFVQLYESLAARMNDKRPEGDPVCFSGAPIRSTTSGRQASIGSPSASNASRASAAAHLWLRSWDVASLDCVASVASDGRDGDRVGGGVRLQSADRDQRSCR